MLTSKLRKRTAVRPRARRPRALHANFGECQFFPSILLIDPRRGRQNVPNTWVTLTTATAGEVAAMEGGSARPEFNPRRGSRAAAPIYRRDWPAAHRCSDSVSRTATGASFRHLSRSHFAARRIGFEHRLVKAADARRHWIAIAIDLKQPPSEIGELLLSE